MIKRANIFPGVIELNLQARRRFGCCVYLVYDEETSDWLLIDVGYEDTMDEIVELIRQLDFPLANCKYLIATHADVDHIQGLKRAKELLPGAVVLAHKETKKHLQTGDRIVTYAEISEQGISIDMPKVKVNRLIKEGDQLKLGKHVLDVWETPGHTKGQLSFLMGNLMFSGDNIYRDGCVGNIDAHHGSDIPDFINSLSRIRDCKAEWLLPSHGPAFKKDPAFIQKTIDRLEQYQHMADFGTCAVDWPLIDEWDHELKEGIKPE